jgi:hypothetical protein
MGLDMFLSAEKYISGWDHNKDEAKASFAKILEAAGLDSEDIACGSPSGTLSLNVMYWRKANAIHNWFVQNIQNGKDDCGRYSVKREQLTLLKNTCEEVIKNKELAVKGLPTKSGFFFGNTDYDEGYMQDVQETADGIGKLLMDPKFMNWRFHYQSSW